MARRGGGRAALKRGGHPESARFRLTARPRRRTVTAMYFKQILNEDCGCSSYIVASRSSRECAVIDSALDIQPYLDVLQDRGLTLRYIIDTHLHADHVSGNRRLSGETGVPVSFHESAIDRVLSLSLEGSRSTLTRAMAFLLESLSPFEMTYRRFLASNVALRGLNEALEDQSRRTARQIHDGAGQILFSLQLALATVRRHESNCELS